MECIHHRQMCDSAKTTGQNVHRCWLDPNHPGPHVCVCWHRWPNTRKTGRARV